MTARAVVDMVRNLIDNVRNRWAFANPVWRGAVFVGSAAATGLLAALALG